MQDNTSNTTPAVSEPQENATAPQPEQKQSLTLLFRRNLLITVAVAFIVSTLAIWAVLSTLAFNSADNELNTALTDTCANVGTASVADLATNAHVGENGFVVIAQKNGTIVSDLHGHNAATLEEAGFNFSPADKAVRTAFEQTVYGETMRCMYVDTGEYYVISSLPSSEVLKQAQTTTLIIFGFEVIIFIVLYITVMRLSRRLVLNDLKKTNLTLSKIAKGDLSARAEGGITSEFDQLSADINTAVSSIRDHMEEESSRIDTELDVARSIQKGALPRLFRNNEWFEMWCIMEAAKELGGDFYDFYPVDKTNLAICVCDVSGKGIPAALFMMGSKALLKGYTEKVLPMGEVLYEVNNRLCDTNAAEMFVTAWYGVFNPDTGHIQYGNAGHNPPLVRRAGGKFEYLRVRPNLVLGGMEDMPYATHEMYLEDGDELFLYTDGVTEATDAFNELFGEDRLRQTLDETAELGLSSRELCEYVKNAIDEFVGEAPQFDDITMVSLKFKKRRQQQ